MAKRQAMFSNKDGKTFSLREQSTSGQSSHLSRIVFRLNWRYLFVIFMCLWLLFGDMLIQASNSYAFSTTFSAAQQNTLVAAPDNISSDQSAGSATSLKSRSADVEGSAAAATSSDSKQVGNSSNASNANSRANTTDFSLNSDSFTNLQQTSQVITNLTGPQPLPPSPPITIVTKIDPKRPLKLPGYFKPTT